MADKLGRNYSLAVERRDGQTLTINLPFSVEFDIHRNSFSSANVASIRIYNLNRDNQAQIRKDAGDTGIDDRRLLQFRAGYGDNLSLGFEGYISQAWSVREDVNMVTQVESYDSGFAYLNAITDQTFPQGTPNSAIVDSLITSMEQYGVKRGSIGEINGTLTRGRAVSGSTLESLKGIVGENGYFLDNGVIHVLKENEYIQGEAIVINANTGLLGTPIVENRIINLDMLFEPKLRVGGVVKLDSQTADPALNTFYKVIALHHHGIVSPVVSGNAVSSVRLISAPDLREVANG